MSGKARVGNWQEELVYEADRKALLREARQGGALLSQQIFAKVKHHNTVCGLASFSDGILRFNSPVMLQNAETNCFLSVDLDDKSGAGTQSKIACTTGSATGSTLRNTWLLVPAPSADDEFWASKGESDVVHYGQKFMVRSLADLSPDPLYLASEKISPTTQSKVSKHQEVFFTSQGRQTALWSFQHAHTEYRFETEGIPVKSTDVVLISHQLTNVPLASSLAKYGNDFGMEWEACCHKSQAVHAKHGKAPETRENLWAVVTGHRVEA